jgi:hypothetical protein
MGKWAAYKRRGGGGPNPSTPAFPLPPPGDGEWTWAQSVFQAVGSIISPPDAPAPYWGLIWGQDEPPLTPGGIDVVADVILVGPLLPGSTYNAQAAWYDSDAVTRLSDWSSVQSFTAT